MGLSNLYAKISTFITDLFRNPIWGQFLTKRSLQRHFFLFLHYMFPSQVVIA